MIPESKAEGRVGQYNSNTRGHRRNFFLKKIYFVLNYVYDVHTSAGVVDGKGISSPGARITGGCEMLDVGIKFSTSERAVQALNH